MKNKLCLLILGKKRVMCLLELIPGSLKRVHRDAGVEGCKGSFWGPGTLLPQAEEATLVFFSLPHRHGEKPELVKY